MVYSIEKKYFAVGKETTRGTAVAPSRYIAVGADSEMEYKLNHIEDELVRGIFEKFPPFAGTKEGTGKLNNLDLTSTNCGELFLSCLGSVVSAQQGGTSAYKHTFTRASGLQLPSYTIHANRDLVQYQYPLSVVKSLAFTGSMDGQVKLSADILFKKEEAEGFALSPTWESPKPFMFHQTTIEIDGVDNLTDIKDWSLNIDNQSVAHRVLNGSQDIADILSFSKLLVSGGFTFYFGTEAERNKFLANTETQLKIKLVGDTIEDPYKHQLIITLPAIHYTAFPFGNIDGLLGAAVTFNAYYKSGVNSVQLELTNTITSY